MRVGLDIDDVLYPFLQQMHAVCEAAGITGGAGIPSQWDCAAHYGCTPEEWHQALHEAIDGDLYTGDPMPQVVESIQRLSDAGHSIHLVTARGFFPGGDRIKAHTVAWLHRHDIHYDSLTFSQDKTLVKTDVFLDDSERNVRELIQAGVLAYLHDSPHNQEFDFPRRLHSVAEFADAVLGIV